MRQALNALAMAAVLGCSIAAHAQTPEPPAAATAPAVATPATQEVGPSEQAGVLPQPAVAGSPLDAGRDRQPYELRLVRFDKGENRKPEFPVINPMGKLPTLVHRDIVVTEAGAICAIWQTRFRQPVSRLR